MLPLSMADMAGWLSGVLAMLGLDPMEVRDLTLLSRRHGSRLYRLRFNRQSYMLKWQVEGDTIEPRAYALFKELRVPTLTVHAQTEHAVLLEDLNESPLWDLAEERDTAYAKTGRVLADWYEHLHLAGRDLTADDPPDWLHWQWEALTPDVVRQLGQTLELPHNPLWEIAARHLPALKEAAEELPITLNHNNFHWSNVALSRQGSPRAVVFDYRLLGIGLAWSDCRNVCSGLGLPARAAFEEAYGHNNPRERLIDAALSPLADLHIALARSQFPPWARALVDEVESGRIRRAVERAVSAL